ncbi:hypothetical protein BCR32DRAFT_293939 [Anaeromyces robustus]|uniref:Uncharacterized protein n=1 Tax=Anaeromyces robustus TaxID=1754192 RepID=A0A1Y1X4E5_9FUNG|nr:hypothetical protein BCR32DRAFT_293939 [Anaeromyces robustus]|eukprot:ORX80236.1 hypothetical protein BCR32DRAFT_293939 [Anaeromyces robustus]
MGKKKVNKPNNNNIPNQTLFSNLNKTLFKKIKEINPIPNDYTKISDEELYKKIDQSFSYEKYLGNFSHPEYLEPIVNLLDKIQPKKLLNNNDTNIENEDNYSEKLPNHEDSIDMRDVSNIIPDKKPRDIFKKVEFSITDEEYENLFEKLNNIYRIKRGYSSEINQDEDNNNNKINDIEMNKQDDTNRRKPNYKKKKVNKHQNNHKHKNKILISSTSTSTPITSKTTTTSPVTENINDNEKNEVKIIGSSSHINSTNISDSSKTKKHDINQLDNSINNNNNNETKYKDNNKKHQEHEYPNLRKESKNMIKKQKVTKTNNINKHRKLKNKNSIINNNNNNNKSKSNIHKLKHNRINIPEKPIIHGINKKQQEFNNGRNGYYDNSNYYIRNGEAFNPNYIYNYNIRGSYSGSHLNNIYNRSSHGNYGDRLSKNM